MKRLWLRIRLWLLEDDIAFAEDTQNRLRQELPRMHQVRAKLLAKYYIAGGEQRV